MEVDNMEAKIIQKHGMKLIGLACSVMLGQISEDKPTTFSLERTFVERKSEISSSSHNLVYGVSTDPENYNPETDLYEYFIGVEVSDIEYIPEGMVVREIPANTYVKFSFKGTADKAGAVHAYLYSTWLKDSEYRLSGLYNIEVYDDRFKGPESEESVTDILFPVRIK